MKSGGTLRARTEDDWRAKQEALAAAQRLHGTASALLVVTSIVFGVTVVSGIAVAALAEGKTLRIAAAAAAAGGAVAWLVSTLACVAAQAIARYIEFRAS